MACHPHTENIKPSIDSMGKTKNRSDFIKFAVLTDNADMAFFRQRQAQMYASYNKSVNPVKKFITIGDISVAKTKDNKIVFNVPLDYMSWTKGLASIARIITQEVALMKNVTGREIWVAGRFSPIARKSLEKMGWTVFEDSEKLISNLKL